MPDPSSSKPSAPEHILQAPTGTRDFYPADLNRLRYIQQAWRTTSINHGFEEIDGPTFEHADLYTIKSGEGILSELFSFERAGGERRYALRPEFTPTLARMYAAKANSLPKPTKWFWMQNCYRAERPQRGRLREFCQWNCDIIGDDSPQADAELIATCVGMLENLGLKPTDVRVSINDRRAICKVLSDSGVLPTNELAALALLDEATKTDISQLRTKFEALNIPIDVAYALTSKTGLFIPESDTDACRLPGVLGELLVPRLEPLVKALISARIWKWCKVDTTIVRGLAYYTGMVFEVHETTGAERAIAGGGRYDKLIELFGGPPTPAVGFGMGDVVLSLVLKDKGLLPTDDQIAAKLGQQPDAFVISNGTPEADAQLPALLADLRRAGLHARRSYKTTKNVGKLLQDAIKSNARFAVIIESVDKATLRNLETQQQEQLPLADLHARIAASKTQL